MEHASCARALHGGAGALNHNRRMTARLSAFFVWAALAASAVFWGLRLAGASPVAPAHTVPVGDVAVPNADLTRLFGAEPAPVATEAAPAPESSRFQLIGVVAPKVAGAPGLALIAVDGKPPRPFKMGAVIDGDLVLQAVQARGVEIGPRGATATVRLELPPLPAAATGTLPPPGAVAMTPGAPQAVSPGTPPGVMRPPPVMQPGAAPSPQMAPPPPQSGPVPVLQER